jgi:hypothetical protein
MIKNGVELLAEMARTEDAVINNTDTSVVVREAEEVLTSVMDTSEDIPMSPEMIPIVRKADKYYVDFSSVYAAATDMGADIGAIMNQILDYNSDEQNHLTPKNLILTIESAEYFDELIAEAKCGGSLGDKAKATLKKATDSIKALKKAGIKVEKKKSKKKKK